MNVVLLAYHYPPDPAVGSLRPAKVVHALRESGHTVTVITATLPEEQAGTRHAESGLKVVAIQPQRNPREWYAAWKRRRTGHSSRSGQKAVQAEAAYAIPARVPFWKRTVFSFMLLPDHRQGFIRPAIRAAAPLLVEPNSILYTTAPPFSVHLAGWRLSRKVRVPWVAEFRDPWTDNAWKPWHVRTAFTDSAERWMERLVLRRASLVVAVSEGIRRGLGTRMEDRTDRLVTVINGIDRLLQAPPATKGEPFRIVHIGSFYYGRDPRIFLSALAALRNHVPPDSPSVRVDLVGNCRWFSGISIEKEVESHGLADIVHFHDWVPHAQAQQFIQDADLLLLLAQNQPNQIPNKLYEYLGTRRSILAIADKEGETARMITQAGGHFLVTDEGAEAVQSALGSALRREQASPSAEDRLLEWTTANQMTRLVKLMEGLK